MLVLPEVIINADNLNEVISRMTSRICRDLELWVAAGEARGTIKATDVDYHRGCKDTLLNDSR